MRMPTSREQDVRVIGRIIDTLKKAGNPNPTPMEVYKGGAKERGYKIKFLRETMEIMSRQTGSLSHKGSKEAELGSLIPDPNQVRPLDNLEKTRNLSDLRKHLAALDIRERLIIDLRYPAQGKACTLQEVADIVGVSKERVRQIEGEALDALYTAFTTVKTPVAIEEPEQDNEEPVPAVIPPRAPSPVPVKTPVQPKKPANDNDHRPTNRPRRVRTLRFDNTGAPIPEEVKTPQFIIWLQNDLGIKGSKSAALFLLIVQSNEPFQILAEKADMHPSGASGNLRVTLKGRVPDEILGTGKAGYSDNRPKIRSWLMEQYEAAGGSGASSSNHICLPPEPPVQRDGEVGLDPYRG